MTSLLRLRRIALAAFSSTSIHPSSFPVSSPSQVRLNELLVELGDLLSAFAKGKNFPYHKTSLHHTLCSTSLLYSKD